MATAAAAAAATTTVAKLNQQNGSISPAQIKLLFVSARDLGINRDELREMAGGSISALSKSQASVLIQKITGQELPNEPGKKPPTYKGKRARPGIIRFVARDHIEQIYRLGMEYFNDDLAQFAGWFVKNWKVADNSPQDVEGMFDLIQLLGTDKRACEVIVVLKEMQERRATNAMRPRKKRKAQRR